MPESLSQRILSAQRLVAKRDQDRRTIVYAAILVLLVLVLMADILTPLGVAIWVFYLFPITLTLLLRTKTMPVILAAICSLLMLITLVTDAEGVNREIAQLNRGFGIVTFWVLALVGYLFIQNNSIVRRQAWIQAGKAGLAETMSGDLKPAEFGRQVLRFLIEYLGADVGAIFVGEEGTFERVATYGVPADAKIVMKADASEGLLGRVITDGRILEVNSVPDGYLLVGSALGRAKPKQLLIAPMKVDNEINAILEIGFLNQSTVDATEFLETIAESVGVAVASSRYRANLQRLLAETRQQAEELQQQGEELRVSNEELEVQSQSLQESQAQLEQQQVELEQTNVQLEEQTQLLLSQRDDLAKATIATQAKAKELEIASRYKSDFLANMSHELRTPLNSSLILSKLLAENAEGNLTAEQVVSAETIYSAGNDLLNLINDILDLSKIEAGKMVIRSERVSLSRMIGEIERMIRPVAENKGLEFVCNIAADVPAQISTDQQRLEQVLKNLLSNAIKFTDSGSVSLAVTKRDADQIHIDVIDTGIGIAPKDQATVFRAFEQLDSAANRKFSGTGLGLTITTELTRILGGEITLDSELGKGSKFRLILPIEYDGSKVESNLLASDSDTPHSPLPLSDAAEMVMDDSSQGVSPQLIDSALSTAHEIQRTSQLKQRTPVKDDREKLRGDQRLILIVEDDESFASILAKVARELQFQCLIATTAQEAMILSAQFMPQAIILDVGLPDETGLVVLDRLKQDARTRHIPVHIISANDFAATALAMGAVGYVVKPVSREMLVETFYNLQAQLTQRTRQVLIVEDDPVQMQSMQKLLGSRDVQTVSASNVAECLEHLKQTTFDCMVLDLTLADSSGYALLETLSENDEYSFPPVIIYTGRELSSDQEQLLRRYSKSIIIKGAKSPERLLDEVTLFLHQVVEELPETQQQMIRKARSRESVMEGRRILVVEDDARNIFALTSILEPRGATIEIARNGKEALRVLSESLGDASKSFDLVLMDVMMPEMDGMTATREIRRQAAFAKLPIIMLTAKAMKDDQAECLAAGANDYMAKPLDVDKLLSLVRVWIRK